MPGNCGPSWSRSTRRTSVRARPSSVSSPRRRPCEVADRADDRHVAARRWRLVDPQRDEAPIDEDGRAVVLFEGGHHIVAREAVLRPVEDGDLLRQPDARRRHAPPRGVLGREARFGQQFVDRHRRELRPFGHLGVELLALVEPPELPQTEADHEEHRAEAQQVEGDPFRTEQEPVHLGDEGTGDDNYRPRG